MRMLRRILSLMTSSADQMNSSPRKERKSLKSLLTTENLKSLFKQKGYKFFDGNREHNINIIGVRRDNSGTNKFDDFILVIYRDKDLREVCKLYPATTDPGEHWLKNPMNPKGTAVLTPGQHRSSWKLGRHQNNYEALVQCSPLVVWRDNNKDEIIDYNNISTALDEGHFGINIHRSNPYNKSYVVNKWSAGCQVFQAVSDFSEFLDLCKRSATLYGNLFSYTLITEQDLREHLNQ